MQQRFHSLQEILELCICKQCVPDSLFLCQHKSLVSRVIYTMIYMIVLEVISKISLPVCGDANITNVFNYYTCHYNTGLSRKYRESDHKIKAGRAGGRRKRGEMYQLHLGGIQFEAANNSKILRHNSSA